MKGGPRCSEYCNRYAIRIVIIYGKAAENSVIRELSENLKISQPFIYKIMRRGIESCGDLAINTGIHGGYILQKETEQINLFEIMDTMERTMKWNRYMRMTGIAAVLQQRHVV